MRCSEFVQLFETSNLIICDSCSIRLVAILPPVFFSFQRLSSLILKVFARSLRVVCLALPVPSLISPTPFPKFQVSSSLLGALCWFLQVLWSNSSYLNEYLA